MPEWAIQEWGFSPWGGRTTAVPSGPNAPYIVYRSPLPDARGVQEDTVVQVRFYDPDVDLDSNTTLIQINGVTVYSGSTGFADGYAGTVTYGAGAITVQFAKIGGWGYGAKITIRAYIADTSARVADDSWQWLTRENPVCYTGTNPLSIETAIQQPMSLFLELETARKVFLDNALAAQNKAIVNSGNKAARVLYQVAFSTELSTLQNLYNPRDEGALTSVVCEKQNTITLEANLFKFESRIRAGVNSVKNKGIFTEDYVRVFEDYLSSTLYQYRASLVANILLAAKAIELQGI